MFSTLNSTEEVQHPTGSNLLTNSNTGLVCLVVILCAYRYQGRPTRPPRPPGRLPPAAPCLPVVGSLPFLGLDPRKALLQMKQKYGDIFTIYLGKRPLIILSSRDAIKDAFVRHAHAFSGRPQNNFFVKYVSRGYGLLSTQGPVWEEQRRFAHNVLRDLGMGRPDMEASIQTELTYFSARISSLAQGQPFDLSDLFEAAVSNIICKIVLGRRYEYDDPDFLNYLHLLNDNFKVTGNSGPLNLFPFLRHLPGDPFHFRDILRMVGQLRAFFRSHIDSHRKSFDPAVRRDFIDAYLAEMHTHGASKQANSSFTDDQLEFVLADLFAAGTETVTATLLWAVIFMLHHPEVQTKVQREIQGVVAADCPPGMHHRALLPYTQATLLEVQRMGDVVPLAAPHKTLEPVSLRGYHLPRGILALPSLHAVHRDPELWKDPDTFDPSRFLDADGKVCKREYAVPYSMGKRVCLGKSMAQMEVFLFFTCLMQKFTFKVPIGCPLPRTSGTLGVTNTPDQFDVICDPLAENISLR